MNLEKAIKDHIFIKCSNQNQIIILIEAYNKLGYRPSMRYTTINAIDFINDTTYIDNRESACFYVKNGEYDWIAQNCVDDNKWKTKDFNSILIL